MLFALLASLPSVAEDLFISKVKGREISFQAPNDQYALVENAKVFVLNGKKKFAIAKVINIDESWVTAKVLKKRKGRIESGMIIKFSKKYKVGSKSFKKRTKGQTSKDTAFRLRPLGVLTGYYDGEIEFGVDKSSSSFSLGLGYLSLESESTGSTANTTVSGFGGTLKYNVYFSGNAISKGLYFSGILGLYSLNVEGPSTDGEKTLSVPLFVPYIGATISYQLFFSNFVLSGGAGGGLFVMASEIESSVDGETKVLENPISGFSLALDLNIGYLF